MAFTNSSLVDYTLLCNDYSKGRYHKNYNPDGKIKKITIHHMAGNLSVEACGRLFATSERQVSSNYGVGTDGRIGLYVEEKNRPWTSSSPANDYQAVTIEVANDEIGGNWHVSSKALESTISLCVDICKRNDIKKLNYTGDSKGNLTMHCFFANTNCPGPYLKSKFAYIANEVNRRLNVISNPAPKISVGDVVSIKSGATYFSGKKVPNWVLKKNWVVSGVSNERIVINKSSDGKNSINSPIYAKFLTVVKTDKKSNKEIAQEIINGTCSDPRWSSWGVGTKPGSTRYDRLTAAGYDAKAVQAEINKMI